MASKKVIIGVVIVAIIAIAAIAAAGGSNTHKDPNARYNYTITETDSYASSISGLIQEPDEGKKFLVLTIAIYNDNCDKAITTNPYIFEWSLSLDGIRHTYLDREMLYPMPSSVEIEKGGHATMVYCWQVDKTSDITNATVSYELSSSYKAIFEQDKSIVVS